MLRSTASSASVSSIEEPPKIIRSTSTLPPVPENNTLGPTASSIPDHSKCGDNCSLRHMLPTSLKIKYNKNAIIPVATD